MRKNILISALAAFLTTILTIGVFYYLQKDGSSSIRIEHVNATPAKGVALGLDENGNLVPLDFTQTAAKIVTAVVHIKSTQTTDLRREEQPQARRYPDPFRDFFDEFFGPDFRFETPPGRQGPQPRVGTGSGVIINENGYIVTNNHVIQNASDIEVTLHDNRTFKATVIGTDPSTDLALIQIKEKNLPTLPMANSDDVKVGEWVLAAGNPFSLNSTVTAGIVSAKARNINILREQFAVESFIQTDAAINPGNSGGALVNLSGSLIGINTAIASPTGVYSGYGFAVPSNIVSKVVEDLLKYGAVQRGVLGVMIRSVDGNLARDKKLEVNAGVYVDSLLSNSAAGAAGVAPGDVIVAIDDVQVKTSPELQEAIAQRRPGDQVRVKVNRKGKEKVFEVTLSNRSGGTELVKKEHKETLGALGADFEEIDAETARKLDIKGGVKITRLYPGKLRRDTQVREGFIITKVDGQEVRTVEALAKVLENKKGGVMLEGVYEDVAGTYYYAFGM
jgi:serine protease Do